MTDNFNYRVVVYMRKPNRISHSPLSVVHREMMQAASEVLVQVAQRLDAYKDYIARIEVEYDEYADGCASAETD